MFATGLPLDHFQVNEGFSYLLLDKFSRKTLTCVLGKKNFFLIDDILILIDWVLCRF
jgi:hypothetical protein